MHGLYMHTVVFHIQLSSKTERHTDFRHRKERKNFEYTISHLQKYEISGRKLYFNPNVIEMTSIIFLSMGGTFKNRYKKKVIFKTNVI